MCTHGETLAMRLRLGCFKTYTSRMRSPLRIPASSAAPLSSTALTCCKGAYNSPLMLRNCPPSLTWPRTLNPNPVSVLFMVTTRGPLGDIFTFSTLGLGSSVSESTMVCILFLLDEFQVLWQPQINWQSSAFPLWTRNEKHHFIGTPAETYCYIHTGGAPSIRKVRNQKTPALQHYGDKSLNYSISGGSCFEKLKFHFTIVLITYKFIRNINPEIIIIIFSQI